MEIRSAILERHSVRGFKDDPVPREIVEDILSLGVRAVSAQNVQPWKIAVVSGDAIRRLRRLNAEDFESGKVPDQPDPQLTEVQRSRAREVGRALLTAMEIEREDKNGRHQWSCRGFRFFDAPTVFLLYLEKGIDERSFRFDMGALAQNICLAAMEYGLGTCVEYQAIMYQRGIREVLNLSEEAFVCGIALGYPDPEFPANGVRSSREPLEKNVTWFDC